MIMGCWKNSQVEEWDIPRLRAVTVESLGVVGAFYLCPSATSIVLFLIVSRARGKRDYTPN